MPNCLSQSMKHRKGLGEPSAAQQHHEDVESCCFVPFRAPSIRPCTECTKSSYFTRRIFLLNSDVQEHGGESSSTSPLGKLEELRGGGEERLAQSAGNCMSVLVS